MRGAIKDEQTEVVYLRSRGRRSALTLFGKNAPTHVGGYKRLVRDTPRFPSPQASCRRRGPAACSCRSESHACSHRIHSRAQPSLCELAASSLVCMNAAQPNFTSSTSASRLSASFLERIEAVMSGMLARCRKRREARKFSCPPEPCSQSGHR